MNAIPLETTEYKVYVELTNLRHNLSIIFRRKSDKKTMGLDAPELQQGYTKEEAEKWVQEQLPNFLRFMGCKAEQQN